jgi:uncharacterized protein YjiS (DUF1127 family)
MSRLAPRAEAFRHRPAALIPVVKRWRRRSRERRILGGLGPRELQDIGIVPADVAREIEKPFWTG